MTLRDCAVRDLNGYIATSTDYVWNTRALIVTHVPVVLTSKRLRHQLIHRTSVEVNVAIAPELSGGLIHKTNQAIVIDDHRRVQKGVQHRELLMHRGHTEAVVGVGCG